MFRQNLTDYGTYSNNSIHVHGHWHLEVKLSRVFIIFSWQLLQLPKSSKCPPQLLFIRKFVSLSELLCKSRWWKWRTRKSESLNRKNTLLPMTVWKMEQLQQVKQWKAQFLSSVKSPCIAVLDRGGKPVPDCWCCRLPSKSTSSMFHLFAHL